MSTSADSDWPNWDDGGHWQKRRDTDNDPKNQSEDDDTQHPLKEWDESKDTSEIIDQIHTTKAKEIPPQRIFNVVNDVGSRTVTVYDVKQYLDYSEPTLRKWLSKLEQSRLIRHRKSGDIDLWWVPESVNIGQEKRIDSGTESLDQILESHKKSDESVEDVYTRLKGSPTIGVLIDILGDGDDESIDQMKEAISNQREKDQKRLDRLRDRFK